MEKLKVKKRGKWRLEDMSEEKTGKGKERKTDGGRELEESDQEIKKNGKKI